jgi:hypothetical protein
VFEVSVEMSMACCFVGDLYRMVKKFLYGTFDISHKYTKIPHEVLRPRNYEVNPTTADGYILKPSTNVMVPGMSATLTF